MTTAVRDRKLPDLHFNHRSLFKHWLICHRNPEGQASQWKTWAIEISQIAFMAEFMKAHMTKSTIISAPYASAATNFYHITEASPTPLGAPRTWTRLCIVCCTSNLGYFDPGRRTMWKLKSPLTAKNVIVSTVEEPNGNLQMFYCTKGHRMHSSPYKEF